MTIVTEDAEGWAAACILYEYNVIYMQPNWLRWTCGILLNPDLFFMSNCSWIQQVATMFAVMKDSDYATKPKFLKNFWEDWKAILGKGHVIKKFELCDFTPIYDWAQAEKERKKSMSAEV